MKAMTPRTYYTLRIIWISYALLFLTQALEAWTLNAPWIIWLAVLLPLLVFLPGMLKDNLRSFHWFTGSLCVLILFLLMATVLALAGVD